MYLIKYVLRKRNTALFVYGNCFLCCEMHRTFVFLQQTSSCIHISFWNQQQELEWKFKRKLTHVHVLNNQWPSDYVNKWVCSTLRHWEVTELHTSYKHESTQRRTLFFDWRFLCSLLSLGAAFGLVLWLCRFLLPSPVFSAVPLTPVLSLSSSDTPSSTSSLDFTFLAPAPTRPRLFRALCTPHSQVKRVVNKVYHTILNVYSALNVESRITWHPTFARVRGCKAPVVQIAAHRSCPPPHTHTQTHTHTTSMLN